MDTNGLMQPTSFHRTVSQTQPGTRIPIVPVYAVAGKISQYIRGRKHHSLPNFIYVIGDLLAATVRAFGSANKYFGKIANSVKKKDGFLSKYHFQY